MYNRAWHEWNLVLIPIPLTILWICVTQCEEHTHWVRTNGNLFHAFWIIKSSNLLLLLFGYIRQISKCIESARTSAEENEEVRTYHKKSLIPSPLINHSFGATKCVCVNIGDKGREYIKEGWWSKCDQISRQKQKSNEIRSRVNQIENNIQREKHSQCWKRHHHGLDNTNKRHHINIYVLVAI